MEYVYLVPYQDETNEPYNPYKLQIVSHASIADKPDYYTLSATGVTHFINGEADFTPLTRWVQEHDTFQKILKIKFFANFRKWKAFYFFKKLITRKKRAISSATLNERLFFINNNKSLRDIRLECIKITELELFKDNKGETLTVEDFTKRQELQKEEVSRQLIDICDVIADMIYEACRDTMIDAGFGDRFGDLDQIPDIEQKNKDNGSTFGFGKNEEENDDEFEEKTSRKVCKRIISFIRLCDFLVLDSLIELVEKSVERILHKIVTLSENSDKNIEEEIMQLGLIGTEDLEIVPLFKVDIRFSDQKLQILPSKEQFDKRVSKVIEGFFEAIRLDKFITRKKFEEYTDPVINDKGADAIVSEGITVKERITRRESYDRLLKSIKETLSIAFKDVEKYAKEYEPIKVKYLENKEMLETEVSSLKEKDLPLEWFQDEMNKYKHQDREVKQMRTYKYKGIFYVDTQMLKETFSPSPTECLKKLHIILPELSKDKNQILYKKLEKAMERFKAFPASVEDFVEFLRFVEKTVASLDELETEFKTVSDFYKLMDDEKVKVPVEDKNFFQDFTVSTISTLRSSISRAEDSKEDRINKFSVDLKRKIDDLRGEIQDFLEKSKDPMVSDVNYADSRDRIEDVISYLMDLKNGMDKAQKRSIELIGYQELFKVKTDSIDEMPIIAKEIDHKLKLWTTMRSWNDFESENKCKIFKDVSAEEVKRNIDNFQYTASFLQKNSEEENPVTKKLSDYTDNWRLVLPIIEDLKNVSLRTRHWRILDNIVGSTISEKNFELSLLFDSDIIEKRKRIQEISEQASNEASLEEQLKKVKENWFKSEFPIVSHKDMTIIGSVEDIMSLLEDDRIVLSTILSSRFVTAIKDQVEELFNDLNLIYSTIQEIIYCQRKWMYLENVFVSADIAAELKEDHKLFVSIDRFYKEAMKRAKEVKNVHRVIIGAESSVKSGLYDKLRVHNTHLDRIEKSLEEYLKKKRNLFPRFYFLSNEDLIDILSHTSNPQAVQPYLPQCFEGMKTLDIDSSKYVKGMISKEGERVQFVSTTTRADDVVEDWLREVEQHMFDTLRQFMKRAVRDYPKKERTVWMRDHIAQVVLTVSQIYWSYDVTNCLTSENPRKELEKFYDKSIALLNDLAYLTRTKLSSNERKLIGTMIILDVHARDVIKAMIEEGVNDVNNFGWLKQLRFYWESDVDDCIVRQSNSVFRYGYEYGGIQSRLVITPLTDRVYMTLTGALHLNLGGSPEGPAGTGKTESVKDLSKALARPCVVYNCSEGVTYTMMYQFFSGIVQVGAWACFDEFNRINAEVLSVIATQLLTIQDALKAKKTRFMLEDDQEISLRHTCGVFITMNPGYAGRTELPDNLKALFRPVAVMLPDYRMIAEVILFSEGYQDALPLSRKMTQLYKLSNEQLSTQDHYDFGMRAMKSVLVMAGELKRANPDLSESTTLMKAMIDSNLPKFVQEDISLFQGIVSDLFPGIQAPEEKHGELEVGFRDIIARKGLEPVPNFIKKVVQFYDTLVIRHGVMLVGPTGGGKSEIRHVLYDTMNYLKEEKRSNSSSVYKVQQYLLNPKSITYGELYGVLNMTTQEWFDGLIPYFARKATKDTSEDKKWIIFDGPVDTLWIESMNSVLDDSKLLCLDNTERIQLNDKISFIFEVQDLAVASPATVSRCGMVFVDPVELGWKPYVSSWLRNSTVSALSSENKDVLEKLFDDYVQDGLDFIRNECFEEVPSNNLNLVTSLCGLIDSLFVDHKEKLDGEKTKQLVNFVFLFCYIWSIGANIVDESMEKFDRFVKEKFKKANIVPSNGSVYDFFVDFEAVSFTTWETLKPTFSYSGNVPFYEIIVPTVDTVRYSYLIKTLLKNEKPVLFNGKTGVGKTSMIFNALQNFEFKHKGESFATELVSVQFSARTDSGRTREMIESKLVEKKKALYAPPGKKVVIFIDDLNMPNLEQFGAQPPIELIRQMIGCGGFFDVSNREEFPWKMVHDSTVAAACGPPGGGRNPTTPRLIRLFHLFRVPELSKNSMTLIFESILDGFFTFNSFSEDIRSSTKPIVKTAIDLYGRVCDRFRPTPSCAHYSFNLRDLSKIFQGIVQVKPSMKDSNQFLRLFAHESCRCMFDRLINFKDRTDFSAILIELLKRYFKGQNWEDSDFLGDRAIAFGNFMENGDSEEKPYVQLNLDKMQTELDDYQMRYNLNNTGQLDLVFFPDAAKNIIRIARILSQKRSNALLIGVGGSGKQSLTRLSSFIAGYKTFEINLKRNYDIDDFREDLRSLFRMAGGVEGGPMVFLITDSQIVDDAFLEDVNNILNSGEVPNLFPSDEKEKLINELRPLAQKAGITETRDAIYAYFIRRVRDNLHIVICMSPVGDDFRRRIRMFPSLVNCTTINWFDEWPAVALRGVAQRKFEKINVGNEHIKQKLVDTCVLVHSDITEITKRFEDETRRKFYITPSHYLEFINFYGELLEEQRLELKEAKDKLQKGLFTLQEANNKVASCEKEIEELQPILEQKTIENAVITKEVMEKKTQADKDNEIISAEKKEIDEKAKVAEAMKRDADDKLKDVLPALEEAEKAVSEVGGPELNLIRSYQNPVQPIKVTLEGVLILLGEKKTDWEAAQKAMSSMDFKKRILSFKETMKEKMTPQIIAKIKKLMKDENFTEAVVYKASGPAGSLCKWVRKMIEYYEVEKIVQPLMDSAAAAQEELEKLLSTLRIKESELQKKTEYLYQLQHQLEENSKEKIRLQDQKEISERRLVAAKKLTVSLKEEYERWTLSVGEFDERIKNIAGDIFLASAFIIYCGPLTAPYRKELLDKWCGYCKDQGIPFSDNYSIDKVIADPIGIRDWGMQGLPMDNYSIQNALIVTKTKRWPLLIDPQEQANNWIKNMEKGNTLKTLKQSEDNYIKTLESYITTGKPVMVEGLSEKIDPTLQPILSKEVFKSKGKLVLKMGNSEIDFNPSFKLYLTTKLANPHYLPEICNKVTLVNFTVTSKGLEDQLLADVVRILESSLEEERDRLIVSVADDKKTLKKIEKKILDSLSSVKEDENILDKTQIIKSLDDSKNTSNVIKDRVKIAAETEIKIELAREKYRSIASRGSILYFVLADLAKIDPMYQYSLEYFKDIFNKCIRITKDQHPSLTTDQLLPILITNVTEFIFTNVCRGLFEKDKIIFSFLICARILMFGQVIDENEWLLFLRGAPLTYDSKNELSEWISDISWNLLTALDAEIPQLKGITASVTGHVFTWKKFFEDNESFKKVLPLNWEGKIKPFHKLLLVKCFAEEQVLLASKEFVKNNLGESFIRPPGLDLEKALNDSTPSTPITFILSQGADPTSMLKRFAIEKNHELHIKSLGQGQETSAKKLIERGRKNGEWVLLQNCHLFVSFMPTLENIIAEFSSPMAVVHKDFRLWLTSMPSKDFPIPILQNSVKVTNEPPKGLRSNLSRTYNEITDEYFYSFEDGEEFPDCSKKLAFRKLLFGLCLFHGVIQERKKFGPLGWNIKYEFNDSDLSVAQLWLKMFLKEREIIPWDSLNYVIGEIVYGGRVTDPNDRRALLTILSQYFEKKILSNDFRFAPNDIYKVPSSDPIEDYRNFILALPDNDEPAIFNMHQNSNMVFQMQETQYLISTSMGTQALSSGGSKQHQMDSIVQEIANKIISKLPENLSKAEAGKNTFIRTEKGALHSLSTVLSHEMMKFNKLLDTIRSTLVELQKAMAGLVLMSGELEKTFKSLLNNEVPELWAAYPSRKPLGSWIEDLVERVAFMRGWLRNGLPKAFWLSGFFFPQGFFTGVLQTYARKYNVEIDSLSFSFRVLFEMTPEEIHEGPEDGVYVYGLYLNGAKWNKERDTLEESEPGEMNVKMPIIHFLPEKNHKTSPKCYEAPLYKTSERKGKLSSLGQSTNFVISVELPTEKPPAHWISEGVALLCQLDI
ncbi:axonemal dynein heavy chain [Naegleria gruberi]|uniref:Axonemal dynein heavy chain n=1 Tax=Naegleria gruberi TaxID=5762 RepID=D2V9X0_NAEGR|nr:axonemal dynein heavy chain [Naegleria gruberi]EFC46212.1 axonemal dynein heavy chain [Naegleria gruberi]|eukprot:XP_002678956.1 axonemal dynein heavy chain [Naegleria gruberi strain NEG-M]